MSPGCPHLRRVCPGLRLWRCYAAGGAYGAAQALFGGMGSNRRAEGDFSAAEFFL